MANISSEPTVSIWQVGWGQVANRQTRLLEHPAVVEKVDFEGPRDVLLAYQGPAVSQEGSENRYGVATSPS